jgi:hypothetical protein
MRALRGRDYPKMAGVENRLEIKRADLTTSQ